MQRFMTARLWSNTCVSEQYLWLVESLIEFLPSKQ